MKYINVSVEQPNLEDSYYSYWNDTIWVTTVDYSESKIEDILNNIPKVELVNKHFSEGEGIISMEEIETYLNGYDIKKVVADYNIDIDRFEY